MVYSLVTVPTKVCCTSGGVYSHLKNWMFLFVGFLSVVVFCHDILLNCWLLLDPSLLLHQDQREKLASQGSFLSNGGEDVYAALDEKAIVVSPVAIPMHVCDRQETFNVECTSVFQG